MEKFVLPEKWVIKATTNEEDEVIVKYINNTFGKEISEGLGDNPEWCYSNVTMINTLDKYDASKINHFPDALEITFQQFLHYVLNNFNTSCEHDPELEIILKRLLE